MKVIGRDGRRMLVDLERTENGVALGCVVDGPSTVSPALPLEQLDAAGQYDQPFTQQEADVALALARDANPELEIPV